MSESESRSVVFDSLQPHGLHSPWNSSGQNTGVSSLSLLQGIFPTQGSNPGLPHCRWGCWASFTSWAPREARTIKPILNRYRLIQIIFASYVSFADCLFQGVGLCHLGYQICGHRVVHAAVAKSLQTCPTLFDPVDRSPPGSAVHGILQARTLEWVAMPSSRGSSQSRDWTRLTYVSYIGS